jgi:hypothetical protein
LGISTGGGRAVLGLGAECQARVEQPFARAVQAHDPVGRHIHAIAPLQPGGIRRQKLWRAIIRGVEAEAVDVFRQNLGHEGGHGVFRLADGHGNGIAAGGVRIE